MTEINQKPLVKTPKLSSLLSTARVNCALTIIVLALSTAGRAQVPDAGVYSIWPGNDTEVLSLPHVKGGQIFTTWKNLEPLSGVYDWSGLDAELALMNSLSMKATVQVNANFGQFPDWIFDEVATCARITSTQTYPQFWDPLYMGFMKRFIEALADHLKNSPYKDNVLLIRQNWNGVKTEQYWLNSADQDLGLCTAAPTGQIFNVPYWDTIAIEYSDSILAYHKAFLPEIPVAVRSFQMSGGWRVGTRYTNLGSLINSVNEGFWFFATSATPFEMGSETFAGFLENTKPGLTVGYSENLANITGLTDPADTSVSREQGAYWTALWNLHRGVSFLCYRGADLADSTLFDSFEFAGKYAGYHAAPATSPGAWIALRPAVINSTLQNQFPDYVTPANYEFHISQLNPDSTSVALTQVGPFPAKESYWSRQTNAGNRMEFILDGAFRNAISGKNLTLRVVYLDQGLDRWSLSYENAGGEVNLGTITKTNTGIGEKRFSNSPMRISLIPAKTSFC